jgi:hypothetical protein
MRAVAEGSMASTLCSRADIGGTLCSWGSERAGFVMGAFRALQLEAYQLANYTDRRTVDINLISYLM